MNEEQISTKAPKEIFPVDFAGYIRILDEPYYTGTDLLDEENNAMAGQFADELKRRYEMFPELLETLEELAEQVAKDCSISSDPKFLEMLGKWNNAANIIKKAKGL